MSKFRKKSIYDIDGIIITHNKIYERIEGNPKHSIAFKSNNDGVVTVVKEVEWNISRYNVLIPRIRFDKINLGSMVEYCTGFSGKYIFNNRIGKGTKIRVILSGEVIPYISEIIMPTYPEMPSMSYDWNETKIHCIALNNCVEYDKKGILYFIKTIKIDNLSVGLIDKLYNHGFNSIDKILKIQYEELLKLDGIKETLAKKIYSNIHKIIDNPIDLSLIMVGSLKFEMGLGIKKIKKILERYPNILNENVTVENIIEIDGFQEKTARQFVKNLKEFKMFLNNLNYLKYNVSEKNLQKYSKFKEVFLQ